MGQDDGEVLQDWDQADAERGVDGVHERGSRWRRRVGIVAGGEDEPRQVGPDLAPAARENAGAHGGTCAVEAGEDVVQHLVGEATDVVLTGEAAALFSTHRIEVRPIGERVWIWGLD
jgi:hypothetical protein